jgi:hypothetical protein
MTVSQEYDFDLDESSEELQERLKNEFWTDGLRHSEADNDHLNHEMKVHFAMVVGGYTPVERGLTTQREWDGVEVRDREHVPF